MAKKKSAVNLDYLKDAKKYPLINQQAVTDYEKDNVDASTTVDPNKTTDRIGGFGNVLNIAIDQARQQRKDSVLDMVGGLAPKGALSATSFASVLGQFNTDAAPLETSLLNNAMSFAQEQNKSAEDAKNAIRELSLKVIEAGGSTEIVAAVLAFSETGDIDSAIKAAGASLSAASGDIKTVGNNLLRVKPDGTYEVIYSAPKSGNTPSSNSSVPEGGIQGYDDGSGLKAGEFKAKLQATVDPAFYAALDTQYNDAEMRQFYEFWMNLNNSEQMTVRADIALKEWLSARGAAAADAGIQIEKPKAGAKETPEESIYSVTGLE